MNGKKQDDLVEEVLCPNCGKKMRLMELKYYLKSEDLYPISLSFNEDFVAMEIRFICKKCSCEVYIDRNIDDINILKPSFKEEIK